MSVSRFFKQKRAQLTNLNSKPTPGRGGYASLSTAPSSGVDSAWPRLGRAFRTAPVSRQTKTNAVWHSPRFHSRPATLLRPPFCPFHRSALFLSAAAQVKEETSRNRQKGKKHEIRRSQHTHQRGRGLPHVPVRARHTSTVAFDSLTSYRPWPRHS